MRLSKYVAHCGLGTRREVVDIIRDGEISVNGEVCTNPAVPLEKDDVVSHEGNVIIPGQSVLHILMNKPRGISLRRGRGKSVYALLPEDYQELQSIVNLPPSAAGLILLSNDPKLIEAAESSSESLFTSTAFLLEESITEEVYQQVLAIWKTTGIDAKVEWSQQDDEHTLLLNGRGDITHALMIVLDDQRIKVKSIDRLSIAGVGKKNISRGQYRKLTKKELIFVKHFGLSGK